MAFGALLVAVAAALAGCRSAGDPVPERVTFGNQGVGARLGPSGGSAMTAVVTFAQRDGFVAVLAILYVLVNFAVDVLYTIVDPRIRHARARS